MGHDETDIVQYYSDYDYPSTIAWSYQGNGIYQGFLSEGFDVLPTAKIEVNYLVPQEANQIKNMTEISLINPNTLQIDTGIKFEDCLTVDVTIELTA